MHSDDVVQLTMCRALADVIEVSILGYNHHKNLAATNTLITSYVRFP